MRILKTPSPLKSKSIIFSNKICLFVVIVLFERVNVSLYGSINNSTPFSISEIVDVFVVIKSLLSEILDVFVVIKLLLDEILDVFLSILPKLSEISDAFLSIFPRIS